MLLANIAPDLQHHVLDQVRLLPLRYRGHDGSLIDIAKPRLLELLARIHMLILNDGEARQLTGRDQFDVKQYVTCCTSFNCVLLRAFHACGRHRPRP